MTFELGEESVPACDDTSCNCVDVVVTLDATAAAVVAAALMVSCVETGAEAAWITSPDATDIVETVGSGSGPGPPLFGSLCSPPVVLLSSSSLRRTATGWSPVEVDELSEEGEDDGLVELCCWVPVELWSVGDACVCGDPEDCAEESEDGEVVDDDDGAGLVSAVVVVVCSGLACGLGSDAGAVVEEGAGSGVDVVVGLGSEDGADPDVGAGVEDSPSA